MMIFWPVGKKIQNSCLNSIEGKIVITYTS